MTPDRWARIDQLLDEALELPRAERSIFLEEVCGLDDDLRREVESLLAAHQKAEEKFLDRPALDLAARQLGRETGRSLIGQTIGHYSVLSTLGIGGMGEVYLARDTKLERKVALKLLPPQYTSDPSRINRFEREARAASALNHPNIITIYDIDQVENRHFIAAEFVDGQTLREYSADRQIAVKEAIDLATQICSALSAAHEAGIVHRDIKPENIMLRRDGYVKVLDFGLAKLTERRRSSVATSASEDDPAKTNPGAVLGTISYMSPEQALGREVDHRSDIFSLGVVLYELMTGAPPFKGNSTAAILDAIVHHRPLPITEIRKDLPARLENIIYRSLEKDRELRYQTAGDLRSDLNGLRREMDSAEMASAIRRASNGAAWLRKRWARSATLASALVALMITVALGWRFLNSRGDAPATNWSNAEFAQLTTMPGRESNACISPDGRTLFYSRLINGQWDIFSQRIGGEAKNITNHPAMEGDAAISPEGERIAFYSSRNGGEILVMGLMGENVRRLTSEGRDPDWSPDGREVVYSTLFGGNIVSRIVVGGQLWVVNVETETKRRIRAGPDAVQPKWSPNKHRIAYWGLRDSTQRDIWTIPADGGEPVSVTNDTHQDGSPVWSPDGKYLYYSSNRNGRMGIWRVAIDELSGKTLGEPELVPTQSSYSTDLSIASDSSRMVYTARRETANIFRVAFDSKQGVRAGAPVQVTFAAGRALNFSVSPDGQSVAYYIYGDMPFDIFISKIDGSSTQPVTNDAHKDWCPRWSPNGSRLAFFSNRTGKYEIWTVNPDGSDLKQLTFSAPDQQGFVLPVWESGPGGTRMAFSLFRGPSFMMDMTRSWQDQTLLAFPPTPDHNGEQTWFNAYAWSPDGRKIIGTIEKQFDTLPGLVAYDLASRQYEQIVKEGASGFWLKDNRRLVYYLNGKIYLVDSQTKKPREILSIPNLSLDDPNVSPDQKWLYYSATSIDEDIWMITLK